MSTITGSFIYVTASVSTQSNLYARHHFSGGFFTDLFKKYIVFGQIIEKEPKLRCLPIQPVIIACNSTLWVSENKEPEAAVWDHFIS